MLAVADDTNLLVICYLSTRTEGHVVAQLVEVLRYKPEGRGFDSLEFFIDIIFSAAL
jgi:hypothetical protein